MTRLAKRGPVDIGAAYELWLEAQLERASAAAALADERRKIAERADIAVKSLEAAQQFEGKAADGKGKKGKKGKAKGKAGKKQALARADPLEAVVAEARKKAEAMVRDTQKTLAEALERAEVEVTRREGEIHALITRVLKVVRPRLRVKVIPVAGGRAIVQAERLGEDEAVLLHAAWNQGRIPSRHGFFSDDTTEDALQAPPRLYAEMGVAEVRPGADLEEALYDDPARKIVPAKGFIPLRLETNPWPRFRLVNRGPVGEFECREDLARSYEHVMTRVHAELLAGWIIHLKMSGRLDAEVKVE
jgi:hypothetical protein